MYSDVRNKTINSNQYSVTEHFKRAEIQQGQNMPGVFFFYDLSPIKVICNCRPCGSVIWLLARILVTICCWPERCISVAVCLSDSDMLCLLHSNSAYAHISLCMHHVSIGIVVVVPGSTACPNQTSTVHCNTDTLAYSQVCFARVVEDEQHFLFECPAYSHIQARHLSLFEHAGVSVASFLYTRQHSLLGRYVRKCYFP